MSIGVPTSSLFFGGVVLGLLLIAPNASGQQNAYPGVPGWAKPDYHLHRPANRHTSPQQRRRASRKELGQFNRSLRQLDGELRRYERSLQRQESLSRSRTNESSASGDTPWMFSSPGLPDPPDAGSGAPGFPDPPDQGGGAPGLPDPPDQVPLSEHGLLLLAMAGGLYAVRRLHAAPL